MWVRVLCVGGGQSWWTNVANALACFPLRPYARYNMHLCLFVGVDSENKTVTFAQGLLSNEQMPSSELAIKHLVRICGEPPQVGLPPCPLALRRPRLGSVLLCVSYDPSMSP